MRKTLIILVLAALCYEISAKSVEIKEDGIVIQDEVNGKQVSISKPFGWGPKNIDIIVSGPNVVSKRIQISDENQVKVTSEDENVEDRNKRSVSSQYDTLLQILGQYQGIPLTDSSYNDVLQQLRLAVQKQYISPNVLSVLSSLEQPVSLELLEKLAPQVLSEKYNDKKSKKKQDSKSKYSKDTLNVQELIQQEILQEQRRQALLNIIGGSQVNKISNVPYVYGNNLLANKVANPIVGDQGILGLNRVTPNIVKPQNALLNTYQIQQQQLENILNILRQRCVDGILLQCGVRGICCYNNYGQQLIWNEEPTQVVSQEPHVNFGIGDYSSIQSNFLKQKACENIGCLGYQVNQQQCQLLGCNVVEKNYINGIDAGRTINKPYNALDQINDEQKLYYNNLYGVPSYGLQNSGLVNTPTGNNYLNQFLSRNNGMEIGQVPEYIVGKGYGIPVNGLVSRKQVL